MILYEKLYQREGNDSWLKDFIQLHCNAFGLYLDHKVDHTGWSGDIKNSYTLELDSDDLESSQELLNKYLYNNSLEDEIKIDLIDLYESR